MRGSECSMCRRPAAWLIDTEVFCEGHKELIIVAAGVDRFRIRRLTEAEPAFRSGGWVSGTVSVKKPKRNRESAVRQTAR